jgi:hypothetical protein
MNTSLFMLSLAQIFIGLITIIFIIYIVLRFVAFWLWKESKIAYNNQSFIIFSSGIILAFGQILLGALTPIQNVIHLLSSTNASFFEKLKYILFFILVVVFIGLICIFSVVYFFDFLTRNIKEKEEIKKNNTTVAILLAVIIFTVSLLIKEPITGLLESFIPYPKIPNFR